jgi:ribosomal protein S18 acetylase RimI-like enzyme
VRTTIRPMTKDDVAGAEGAWHAAFSTMRAAYHLPVEPRSPETARRTQGRIAHLLGTDPSGSWVAVDDDAAVVGLSQALIRDELWVLSLLGVDPRCQDGGVGRDLLDAALAYGREAPAGLILSSRDPRAARRYFRAGFAMNPSVTAAGRVDPRLLGPRSPNVRTGAHADTDFAAELDRHLRRGPHGRDLEFLLAEGCRFLVLPERGYVVARGARPVILAAVDATSAAELLASVLADADAAEHVEVNWMTAAQQWAIGVALDAGLELRPVGPVMTRGLPGPPTPYLPSVAFA